MKKNVKSILPALIAAGVMLLAACADSAVQNTQAQKLSASYAAQEKALTFGKPRRNDYTPLNYAEQKAVWFSYIDVSAMLTGKTEAQFTAAVGDAFDKTCALGCNTVYVHVRAFGDAYYASDLFPWTKSAAGTIGEDPGFDPLSIMIAQAHDRGLSFHAWINPMRCETEANLAKVSETYTLGAWYNDAQKNGTYLVKPAGDNHLWLNPAYPEVRTLIAAGAAEIVSCYDVDGLNIDDYFYPTTDASFDKAAFVQTGGQSLTEFRLSNTSLMVQSLYNAVKSANPKALFGISPQGNVANNYSSLYADVKLWCAQPGYADYITPQVYYGYNTSAAPYADVIAQWNTMVENSGVKLVIGLAVYKLGEESEFSDTVGIIGDQIADAKTLENYGGVALYNYLNLFAPTDENAQRVKEELPLISAALGG
ncbi:MAG: family 10 glycosylhydrolase [Oscillospiraceae bacterium]